MQAMVLAAGRGVRMGQLTATRPKPLLEVAGRTLIERNLVALAAAGIHEVVVNLSYRGAQLREALGDGSALGLSIVFSQEPEPPLETAGGIVRALPLLDAGAFVLVNADVVTDFDLARLAGREPTLVLVPNPPHHPAGDFGLGTAGRLTHEQPRFTFSGISVLDTAMFAGLADGPRQLKPVLDSAIGRGALSGVLHDGLWLDVGTPQRLAEASRRLAVLD
jgi:MurNAc alpha-1-phosphate uridylyltransferase